MSDPRTVLDIIAGVLVEGRYDGLYNPDGECGCERDDLSPGACFCEGCIPGHKVPCDPETCPADGDCEYHIGPREEVKP